MERTHISQLFADMDALGGTTVTVAGWVRSVRDMKNFGFVMLNDGSCFKDHRRHGRGLRARGHGHARAHAGPPAAL